MPRTALRRTGEQTVLFIDEMHRFSKTQQDSLLGAVEDRTVILIAATTENPFFSVVSPLLSRSLVLQLQPLADAEVGELVDRAVHDDRGLGDRFRLDAGCPDPADRAVRRGRPACAHCPGGGCRRVAVAGPVAADTQSGDRAPADPADVPVIDLAAVERAIDKAAVRYDRDGDQHYDVISAFIKSIRGSDVDAALHYLARMIEAGEDPRFIARRLMVHASEDIGMADPTALPVAVAAAQVVQLVGLPEARIGLAQATIHLASAPKSNAVVIRDRRRAWPTSGPGWPAACRAAARRPLPGGRAARQRAGLQLPAGRPGQRGRPNSTRRTSWSAATTTGPPTGVRSACCPSDCQACGGSSAVNRSDRAPEPLRQSPRRSNDEHRDARRPDSRRPAVRRFCRSSRSTQPEPAAGQITVAMAAVGVNFIDIYERSGVYPKPLPLVLGTEGAGTVVEVGAGVDAFAVGDRVASADLIGAYAQVATGRADVAVKVPDTVPDDVAAAVMLQGITAHYLATDSFPIAPGDTVLIHAGAGGVGLLLTQIAKIKGATVFSTVSNQAKAELSRAAGADEVLVGYGDFDEQVRELTGGKGVRAVYDGVGKDTFDRSLSSLGIRGTMVLFGGASGQVPPFDIQRLNRAGSLFLTRPTIKHHMLSHGEVQARADDLFAWIGSGRLTVSVSRSYPLGEVAAAQEDLAGRRTTGKLLLIP